MVCCIVIKFFDVKVDNPDFVLSEKNDTSALLFDKKKRKDKKQRTKKNEANRHSMSIDK